MSDSGGGAGHDGTANEIVVSVGDSPAAAAALRWAAQESGRTGVPLRIVYIWQITPSPVGAVSNSFWVASAADARARATHWVIEVLGNRAATVRWVLDIVEGPPEPILAAQPGGSA